MSLEAQTTASPVARVFGRASDLHWMLLMKEWRQVAQTVLAAALGCSNRNRDVGRAGMIQGSHGVELLHARRAPSRCAVEFWPAPRALGRDEGLLHRCRYQSDLYPAR